MPGDFSGRLPLTSAQTGMWFAQQLDPQNPIYKAAEYIDIRGPVDLTLIEIALRQAVTDTEAFRVRIEADDEGIWQLVERMADWPLPVLDLRGEADPWTRAQEWMWTDLSRSVDLGRGPAFTWTVLQLATDWFLLYAGVHHLVMDGFGFSLFVQRVAEVYTALEAGRECPPSTLGSLELLLADDASYHASERFAQDREYWENQLADRPAAISLARRLARTSHTFLRHTGSVPAPIADQLRALARRARASLPTLAMTALAVYVHRLTGARDLMLGLAVTGRTGTVARYIPGMLTNQLPLRVHVHPAMSIGGLVRHVAEQARGLLRHQRYPYQYLARNLDIVGTGEHLFGPVINIMGYDSLLRFGQHPATLHNLANGPVDDLVVNVYERSGDGALRIDFNANPALYRAEDNTAHHCRFLNLLETLADTDLQQPVGRVDLLTPGERHQVLNTWNDTAYPVPPVSFPVLFQTQVARAPDATAVVFGDVILSYAQLNTRANRLAHMLIAHGVGPEQIVALALSRGPDLAVAILAVLKAGAAYLPLDPDYPAARIGFMLRDAYPVLFLTSEQTAACVPEDIATARLVIDDPDTLAALRDYPGTDPTDIDRTTPLMPHHSAYVIYTSGSTGYPKGVLVCHTGISSFAVAKIERLDIGAHSRVLQFASSSFDASVFELLVTFVAGAALIMSPMGPLVGETLVRVLADADVSHAAIPPTVLAGAPPADLAGLQTLVVAGEACPADLVAGSADD